MTPNKKKIELFDKLTLKLRDYIDKEAEITYEDNEVSEEEAVEIAIDNIKDSLDKAGILIAMDEIVDRAIYHYADEVSDKIDRATSKHMTALEFKLKIAPLMKRGYLAMDKDGQWFHYNQCPEVDVANNKWCLTSIYDSKKEMFSLFELEEVNDWTKSLIILG